jgi:hypothetical protein
MKAIIKILVFFSLGVQLLFDADVGKIIKLADGTYQTVKFIGKNAENFIDELKRLTLDAESLRVLNDDLNTPAFATALTENPGLLESWKKMLDLNADEVIRKNPGALEAFSKPKGSRPDPSIYLSQKYIDDHLSKFNNEGKASRIVLKDSYDEYGIGKPDVEKTEFVSLKSDIDKLLSEANGNINIVASELGVPVEQLQGGLVRIDFNINSNNTVFIPSGNEFGTNPQWIPGGKLVNGKSEAIVKTQGMVKDIDYTVTELGF